MGRNQLIWLTVTCAVASFMGSAAVAWMFHAADPAVAQQAEIIRARGFAVTDAAGKVWARLGFEADGTPGLILR